MDYLSNYLNPCFGHFLGVRLNDDVEMEEQQQKQEQGRHHHQQKQQQLHQELLQQKVQMELEDARQKLELQQRQRQLELKRMFQKREHQFEEKLQASLEFVFQQQLDAAAKEHQQVSYRAEARSLEPVATLSNDRQLPETEFQQNSLAFLKEKRIPSSQHIRKLRDSQKRQVRRTRMHAAFREQTSVRAREAMEHLPAGFANTQVQETSKQPFVLQETMEKHLEQTDSVDNIEQEMRESMNQPGIVDNTKQQEQASTEQPAQIDLADMHLQDAATDTHGHAGEGFVVLDSRVPE